jgi:uroporphyrinogen-III synthase
MGGQPLAGRSIVVTRPAGQADSLCAVLAALGAEPLRFRSSPSRRWPIRPRCRMWPDGWRISLAFFVSPNAVHLALDAMLPVARGRRASPSPRWARAARRRWPPAALPTSSPRSGFDSESVLALPAFQAAAVAGRRVLILRGDGGRDLLGDTPSSAAPPSIPHLLPPQWSGG